MRISPIPHTNTKSNRQSTFSQFSVFFFPFFFSLPSIDKHPEFFNIFFWLWHFTNYLFKYNVSDIRNLIYVTHYCKYIPLLKTHILLLKILNLKIHHSFQISFSISDHLTILLGQSDSGLSLQRQNLFFLNLSLAFWRATIMSFLRYIGFRL